jgi:hypothetical protein
MIYRSDMTAKELSNINQIVKRMIVDHMERYSMTLNAFSKQAGVHQNQLWMYLYSGDSTKGLHSGTLEKIGKYLSTF